MKPRATRPPRIFIGLREVSGFGRGLKAGFDQIGVESAFLNIGYHHHRYETSNNPAWADRLATASQKLGRYFTIQWWRRILWIGFVQNLFSVMAFPWALWRYDAFIYISVSSFCFFLELPILKLFGKKVIYVFAGSDTRPVYLNGYVMTKTSRGAVRKAIALARIQKICVWIIDRYADVVVNAWPSAHFHTRPIVSSYYIGIPAEYTSAMPGQPEFESESSRVRILHAPSKLGPKGTAEIRLVIQALHAKGLEFDYVEITGRPHAEVLAEIQRASFVIDELYSDTPMAAFATEAAFFGKPSVVGSYYCSQIAQVLHPDEMPPSLFCHPDEIECAIERMITDHAFREDIGRRAQIFVRDHWSARRVAEKYLMLINGTYPREWLFDPKQIRYLEGCGLKKERGIELVRAFLAAGGPGTLCLNDKPELAALFVGMAKGADRQDRQMRQADTAKTGRKDQLP